MQHCLAIFDYGPKNHSKFFFSLCCKIMFTSYKARAFSKKKKKEKEREREREINSNF